MQPSALDGLAYEAGVLAFAMLRFESDAAHPTLAAIPRGVPRIGVDCYVFAPSSRHVLVADVPGFLATLQSPAVLIPTTTRGVVSLMLLDELSGERRASAERALKSQRDAVERRATELGLTDDSVILLQFAAEEHRIRLAALRERCDRFAIAIATSLVSHDDDDSAQARLILVRSDGVTSSVEPCPVERLR